MQGYTLQNLSLKARKYLLTSHYLSNVKQYRESKNEANFRPQGADLFDMFGSPEAATVTSLTKTSGIIWATDSYDGHKENFFAPITLKNAALITPRSEKAKAEQKKRTKDKAEVFTPSWLCNLQNNLVDDQVLYPGAFNTGDATTKTWEASAELIDFSKAGALSTAPQYSWVNYLTEKRLEITCGEGPYLMSRYDTVTGEDIPVRDAQGRYQRIGVLDRKLRVVNENLADTATQDEWSYLALEALKATYGYEWQGDNLLLARLNFLNTYVDYFLDRFPGNSVSDAVLEEVAEIASWQLWQMDGLKMIQPLSCDKSDDSPPCSACIKKDRTGHNGNVSVIRWGDKVISFEELLL